MKFDKGITNYLSGKEFSTSLKVKFLESKKGIIEKEHYVLQKFDNKTVIHLGFADHLPIIDEKIKSKTWFHNKVVAVSKRCIGIDINDEAVQHIKDRFYYSDIFSHDVMGKEYLDEIINNKWDYIYMGDVLEHINNPVSFLERIKAKYSNSIKSILVTVPNAYSFVTLRSMFKNEEFINTDHRYWFTPYTLAKILTEAGLKVEEFQYCNAYYQLASWEKIIVKRFPILNHSIVMSAKFE